MKGFLVLLALAGAFVFWQHRPENDLDHRRDLAAVLAHDSVKQLLLAPASAEFPRMTTWIDFPNDQFFAKVHGIVDSQNRFGAMLRASYTCDVYLREGTVAGGADRAVCKLAK
jgi:hypothetical protein